MNKRPGKNFLRGCGEGTGIHNLRLLFNERQGKGREVTPPGLFGQTVNAGGNIQFPPCLARDGNNLGAVQFKAGFTQRLVIRLADLNQVIIGLLLVKDNNGGQVVLGAPVDELVSQKTAQ